MTSIETMALDAIGNGLVAVAARSATTMIGRRRRRGEDEGEGQSSAKSKLVQNSYSKLTYANHTYGRPMSLGYAKSLVSQEDCGWVKYQWGQITKGAMAEDTSTLAYQLINQENVTLSVGPTGTATSVASATEYPLHVIHLTSRNYNTSGTTGTNVVGQFMYANGSAPFVKFGCLRGVSNVYTGVPALPYTPTDGWNVWAKSDSNADTTLSGTGDTDQTPTNSLLKSVSVELLLQGCKASPTTFYVSLFSIGDDEFGPSYLLGANQSRDNAYLPFVHKLLGSCMGSRPMTIKSGRDGVRILKTWEYFMEPSISNEYDTTPPHRHVKIDLNLNKTLQWNWTASATAETVTLVDDANFYTTQVPRPVNTTQTNEPPNFRDRLFLMIRATAPNQGNKANNTPNYDARVIATHVFKHQA